MFAPSIQLEPDMRQMLIVFPRLKGLVAGMGLEVTVLSKYVCGNVKLGFLPSTINVCPWAQGSGSQAVRWSIRALQL